MAHEFTSIETLLEEIAAQNHVGLSPDDPILVLHTIQRRVLQDSLEAQQAQLDQYQQALESLSLRWSNDARDKAERSLNAALTAGRNALAQAVQDSAGAAAQALRAELDTALERVGATLERAHRIALLQLLAAGLTLCAAVLAGWRLLA
ncbi:MAG: conjugal transfer protein TraM [Comamonas sp.]